MDTLAPGLRVLPLRSPTLPPATHTNCYVVGHDALTVFDPASPWEDGQQLLDRALRAEHQRGVPLEAIVLTHHHGDHIAGAMALQQQAAQRGLDVPILCHEATESWVSDRVTINGFWADQEQRDCGGVRLTGHHTPGHAPGHLVFQDAESQMVIAGDMVAGVGTIAIGLDDGHLGQYLASLEAMRELGASALLPAHGPSLPHADALLGFYIAHRHQRSQQVSDALHQRGRSSPMELVPLVYPDIPDAVHPIAAVQITSHLRWLEDHGQVLQHEGYWERR